MWAQLVQGVARGTPARCEVCHVWPARPVCAQCEARFAAPHGRCRTCAVVVPDGIARCGQCLGAPPLLDACLAAVTYGYPWSALVGRFKFGGEAGWSHTFAALLARDPAVRQEIGIARWVIPMPLSRERLMHRGFNQAHELSRRLAPAKADPRIALRVRDTASQANLDHADRQANVRRAFAIEPARADALRGHAVLLVDDVMTTGASLGALAQVFRDAGVSRVAAVVFARTEDH